MPSLRSRAPSGAGRPRSPRRCGSGDGEPGPAWGTSCTRAGGTSRRRTTTCRRTTRCGAPLGTRRCAHRAVPTARRARRTPPSASRRRCPDRPGPLTASPAMRPLWRHRPDCAGGGAAWRCRDAPSWCGPPGRRASPSARAVPNPGRWGSSHPPRRDSCSHTGRTARRALRPTGSRCLSLRTLLPRRREGRRWSSGWRWEAKDRTSSQRPRPWRMKAQISSLAWRHRYRVGVTRPDGEGAVNLLADQGDRAIPFEVAPEEPVVDSRRDDVVEQPHHVESDHHQRPSHRGRACRAGRGLRGHGQPEEGGTLVDPLQNAARRRRGGGPRAAHCLRTSRRPCL